jgi:hypothetical protein
MGRLFATPLQCWQGRSKQGCRPGPRLLPNIGGARRKSTQSASTCIQGQRKYFKIILTGVVRDLCFLRDPDTRHINVCPEVVGSKSLVRLDRKSSLHSNSAPCNLHYNGCGQGPTAGRPTAERSRCPRPSCVRRRHGAPKSSGSSSGPCLKRSSAQDRAR